MQNRAAGTFVRAISRLTAAVAVVLVLAPANANANADENVPWAITPVMPANGGTYVPSPPSTDGRVGGVTIDMASPVRLPAGTQASVEVTAENVPGQDGTLANDKVVSFGLLYARDSDPSQWTGVVSAGAFRQPGTYYFQFSAYITDYSFDSATYCPSVPPGGTGSCLYVSPVFTFTIAAPAPAAAPPAAPPAAKPEAAPRLRLTNAQAVIGAKRWAAQRYHGKRWTATCSRINAARLDCRVRYVRAGKRRELYVDVRRTETGLQFRRR